MKIIIVDDNEDAREILRKTLEGAGHEVETASDGLEALKAAGLLGPTRSCPTSLCRSWTGFTF